MTVIGGFDQINNKKVLDKGNIKQGNAGTKNQSIWSLLGGLWDDWTGKSISDDNISFQQRENEITRKREDNAVQRRVADLKAAGLSPTLAAGSPAQSAQMQAPQSSEKSGSEIAENLGSILQGAMGAKNLHEQILTQREQRKQIKLSNDFLAHDLKIVKDRKGATSKDKIGTIERLAGYFKGTPVGQAIIGKVKDIASSDFNPAEESRKKREKKAKVKKLLKLRKKYSRYKKSKKYQNVVKQLKLLGVN